MWPKNLKKTLEKHDVGSEKLGKKLGVFTKGEPQNSEKPFFFYRFFDDPEDPRHGGSTKHHEGDGCARSWS